MFKNYKGVKTSVGLIMVYVYKLTYKAVVMNLIMITANLHYRCMIYPNYVHWDKAAPISNNWEKFLVVANVHMLT